MFDHAGTQLVVEYKGYERFGTQTSQPSHLDKEIADMFYIEPITRVCDTALRKGPVQMPATRWSDRSQDGQGIT